jgi:hypothetical protein
MSSLETAAPGYTGLTELTEGLPAEAYFDPPRLRARIAADLVPELGLRRPLQRDRARSVLCVPSRSAIKKSCWCAMTAGQCCRPFTIPAGIAARSCAGRVPGHCASGSDRLPLSRMGVHLQGELLRTTSKRSCPRLRARQLSALRGTGARMERFRLRVPGAKSAAARAAFRSAARIGLDAWPLEDLVIGHVLLKTIQCNWKIYWENYNECLHCPGVHPKLSQLVPIFGRGLAGGARRSLLEPAHHRRSTRSSREDCAAARRPGRWTAKRRAVNSPGLSG